MEFFIPIHGCASRVPSVLCVLRHSLLLTLDLTTLDGWPAGDPLVSAPPVLGLQSWAPHLALWLLLWVLGLEVINRVVSQAQEVTFYLEQK